MMNTTLEVNAVGPTIQLTVVTLFGTHLAVSLPPKPPPVVYAVGHGIQPPADLPKQGHDYRSSLHSSLFLIQSSTIHAPRKIIPRTMVMLSRKTARSSQPMMVHKSGFTKQDPQQQEDHDREQDDLQHVQARGHDLIHCPDYIILAPRSSVLSASPTSSA